MVQWTVGSIPHSEPIELFLIPASTKAMVYAKDNIFICFFTVLVPGKVQYLFIQSRGSRYFLLEWKEPENPNGELLGYQIGYKKRT